MAFIRCKHFFSFLQDFMGLGSSNFTMSLLWMIFGVIYQLNSLLKAQAFPLFCGFFFCTTFFRLGLLVFSLSCLVRASLVRLTSGFSAAVFLLLDLHVIQKATLEPAFQFGVSLGAGTEHSDLLHTDAWQLKQ